LQGIQKVQQQQVSVTKRSINIIKEYRNYVWITDRDGKILNEPIDLNNHAMDAGRYATESIHKANFVIPTGVQGGAKPMDAKLGY
jgi:phage terminase large subunit